MTNETTTANVADVINRKTICYATGSRNNERIFLVVANETTRLFAVYDQDRNNVRKLVARFDTEHLAVKLCDLMANETDAERLGMIETANKDIADLRETLQPYGEDQD